MPSAVDPRVPVVTGGAGAHGGAIATGLSRDGSTVVLVDLDKESVEKAAHDIAAETDPGGHRVGRDISSDDANQRPSDAWTLSTGGSTNW